MNASDLRIGNWVKVNGKNHQIHASDIVAQVQCDVACVKFAEPIKLSHEIFAACGFEQINHVDGYPFYAKKECGIDIHKNYTSWRGKPIYSHAENLHELQNLYSMLMGEELKVNLIGEMIEVVKGGQNIPHKL